LQNADNWKIYGSESYINDLLGTIARLLIVPLSIYGIMRISGVQGLPARISVFLAAMPAAAQTVIFAERYSADVPQ
jgi:predicted permease